MATDTFCCSCCCCCCCCCPACFCFCWPDGLFSSPRCAATEAEPGSTPQLRPLSPPLAAASEPVLVGEIQVPPGVGPPINAAAKKDPAIEHFHSEQLHTRPRCAATEAEPGSTPQPGGSPDDAKAVKPACQGRGNAGRRVIRIYCALARIRHRANARIMAFLVLMETCMSSRVRLREFDSLSRVVWEEASARTLGPQSAPSKAAISASAQAIVGTAAGSGS